MSALATQSPSLWTLLAVALCFLLISFHGVSNAEKTKEKIGAANSTSPDLVGAETSHYPGGQSTLNYVKKPQIYYARPSIGQNHFNLGTGGISFPGILGTGHVPQAGNCGDSFPGQCRESRYRTYDGSCNNIFQPTWGQANTRYDRLVRPIYSDGVREPTLSGTGKELPLARLLSFTLHPDVNVLDEKFTLGFMQWGQIMTHDMGMITGTTQTKPHSKCCTDDGRLIPEDQDDPSCFPILIPINDPVYAHNGIECLNFVRSGTDIDQGCNSKLNFAEQTNIVTAYLDLSIIYGSSDQVASQVRAGVGGRLQVEIRGNREWLPSNMNKTGACHVDSENSVCYLAGDMRVNQNPQLAVLHVILWREHNRIASALSQLNPHWSDETIFEETRRIVIAEHQHISYYEYLPILIGKSNAYKYKLLYDTDDYVNDYDSFVNPNTLNEHANAAFRYFHSLVAGYLDLIPEQRCPFSCPSLRLSNHFNRPAVIEDGDNFDDLTRGLATQPEKKSDQFFDKEITNFLFRHNKRLGGDLRATDIQRNRDHGLASYNDYREYCGLPRAHFWEDFQDYISPENINKLAQLYESPNDVDVTVGGSLESHVPGTLSGPTFLCILVKQFYKSRVGDRYWYETGNQNLAFTLEQLNEIRKASISRLYCDNGDNIKYMQPKGFWQISHDNHLVSCDDLPAIDLSYWKDYSPKAGGITSGHFFKK